MAAKTNAKSQFQRRREISEMERIEKQRDYLVVKANALANTYPYEMSKSEGGPLSEQQNKVISYLISQIRPEDTAIPTFTFDMKRFALVCGIDPSGGSYYNNLKKSIKSLMNKTVELRSTDGMQEILLHYITRAVFDKGSRTCTIQMDPTLTGYLIGLKSNFYSYQFKRIAMLKSKFSIPIYELLKSHSYKSTGLIVEIDDLKERLGCKSYNISNFSTAVLDKSVEEINKYTDLYVEYELAKEGRKYKYVCFDVRDLSLTQDDTDKRELYRRNQTLEYEFDQMCLFPITM